VIKERSHDILRKALFLGHFGRRLFDARERLDAAVSNRELRKDVYYAGRSEFLRLHVLVKAFSSTIGSLDQGGQRV